MKRKRLAKVLVVSVLALSLLITACTADTNTTDPITTTTPTAGSDTVPSASPNLSNMTDPNVRPAGEFPICIETTDLTIGLIQSLTVEDYETNALTQYMEELSNMDFVFNIFPSKDAMQKLEVLINSGTELPEVLIGFGLDDMSVLNYGSQEAFLPLNDYIDTIGVEVHDAFERVAAEDLRGLITSADGNIYFLPKHTEQVGNEVSQRQWINQVWLDKLELDMPTTTDDFTEVLKAFRDKDPNGNGKKDEIPYTGGQLWQGSPSDAIMNAFIYNDAATVNVNPRWLLKDGKLDVPYTKPEWKDGLAYANMLVEEGLLSPLSFTQDNAQMTQLLESGDESVVGVYTAGAYLFGATNERKLEYASLPPLTGPKGVSYTAFYPSLPKAHFIITKDAQHPEAAFRLGDAIMARDFGFRSRWGEPEVDWRVPGPDDVGLYEDLGFEPLVVPILPWGSIQNKHWANELNVVLEMGVQDGQAVTLDDPLYTELFIARAVPNNLNHEPDEYVDKIKYTVEETDEIKQISAVIVTYVNECMARFITGDMDLDTQWEEYLQELDNIGLSKLIDVSQVAYDRNH